MEINTDLTLPLRSASDLEAAVKHLGILPFFKGNIRGFSVEDIVDPDYWFSDNEEVEGPWEWKGMVIRRGEVAYGKFFKGKAIYMRLDIFSDFLNYRRANTEISHTPIEEVGGLSDESLLRIFNENGALLSSELKEMLGLGRHRKRRAEDLVDVLGIGKIGGGSAARSALDAMLARLQMAGRLCIADFEYPISASGKQYGWGLARYALPEELYGTTIAEAEGRTPTESRQRLVEIIHEAAPQATLRSIHTLLG